MRNASPPGTFGAIAADQSALFHQHRAHDHHGPPVGTTVVTGQEGLAKNTGAPYGGIA